MGRRQNAAAMVCRGPPGYSGAARPMRPSKPIDGGGSGQHTEGERAMRIIGKWRITEMDMWDQVAFDLLGPAFFSFDGKRSGNFRFIAVEGWMDCRYETQDGKPFVEFTWDGNDECDPASGRGWVRLEGDGTLSGHVFFHQGDDSGFKAIRAEKETRSPKALSGSGAKPGRSR